MIKAVIFDMFETLVTLFTGRTYFSEHIAADLGQPIEAFRKCWHETEKDRTLGKYSMEEGLAITLKNLGARSLGMQAIQCTWFRDLAYEPHIPSPLFDDFPHAATRQDIINFINFQNA